MQQFYHLITVAPLTQYRGWFGPRVADQTNLHGWVVDVFARFSPKVSASYYLLGSAFAVFAGAGVTSLVLGLCVWKYSPNPALLPTPRV